MKKLIPIAAIIMAGCADNAEHTNSNYNTNSSNISSQTNNDHSFLYGLMGGAVGSMLGNAISRPSPSVINRTVVIEKRVVEPPKPQVATPIAPRPSLPAAAPSRPISVPSFRPSPSFGKR